LHNGNRLPSIPVAHAVHMKETWQLKAATEYYWVYKARLIPLWWVKGSCPINGTAAGIYNIQITCVSYVSVTTEQGNCTTCRKNGLAEKM